MPDGLAGKSAVPKYILAEQAILDAIASGRYRPGDRLPGERTLAKHFSIAPLTVRQATARLVERGILERRERIGTFVRAEPSAGNVALLIFNVPHIEPGSLPARELETLRAAAAREGRHVRVMVLLHPLPAPERLVAELRHMDVGAVGLLDFLTEDRPFVETIARELPCVLFNKTLPGVSLPCAKADHFKAAELMVDYFVRRGRGRVGMAFPATNHPGHIEFASALEGELRRHDMAVNNAWWFFGKERTDIPALHRWLSRTVAAELRPDALILANSRDAAHLQRELEARGERFGEEMDAIVTYSDVRPDDYGAPWPLMALNHGEASEMASRMLLDLVRGNGARRGAPVVCSTPELLLPETAGASEVGETLSATS